MISAFVVFSLLSFAAAEQCYDQVTRACSSLGGDIEICNARYSGANDEVIKEFQSYANMHITRNWLFMLMSSHFNNYVANRNGFSKLFKEYSDKLWEDSIDLIKQITKRGGQMDFKYKKVNTEVVDPNTYEVTEIGALSLAIDMYKSMAETSHRIHGEVTRHHSYHDPEFSSYLENKFVHPHAEIIRDLAGHTNDLKGLISNSPDPNLATFLFDEYLQKK